MAQTSIIKIGADLSGLEDAFNTMLGELKNLAQATNDSFKTTNQLFNQTTDAINAQRKQIDLLTESFKNIGGNISAGLGGVRNAVTKNTTEVVNAVNNQGKQIDRSIKSQTIVIKRLQQSFTDLSNTVKQSSIANVKAIKDQTTQITSSLQKMTDTLNKTMQEQLDVMRKTAQYLGVELQNAGKNGQSGMDNAAAGARRANDVLRRTGDIVAILNKGFEYLKWTITRAFYFGAVLQFQSAIANVAKEGMEYEQEVANLQTVTNGNLKVAVRLYQQINDLADRSTFSVAEMVKTSLILNKGGLSPTVELLEAMGKFAAGTGQSMFTLATSISNVAASEESNLRGLLRLGVKATVVGDKLQVSYKGQTEMIGRSAKALSDYLIRLSKTEEFMHVMDVQMNGVTGAQKRLSEAWSAFSRQIFFSGASQFLVRFFDETREKVYEFIEILQSPKVAAAFGAFGQAAFTAIESVTFAIGILKDGILGIGEVFGLILQAIPNFDESFNAIQNGVDDTTNVINGDMQSISDKGQEASDALKSNFKNAEDDILSGWTRLFRVLTLGLNTIIATVKTLGESFGYLTAKVSDTLSTGDRFDDFLKRENAIRKAKGEKELDRSMFSSDLLTLTQGYNAKLSSSTEMIEKSGLATKEYKKQINDARLALIKFNEEEANRQKVIEKGTPSGLSEILRNNFDKVEEADKAFIRNVKDTVKKAKEIKDALNDESNNYTGGADRFFGDNSDTSKFDRMYQSLLDKQMSFADKRVQIEYEYKKKSDELEKAIAESKGITDEQAQNARNMLIANKEKELTKLMQDENGKRSAGARSSAGQQRETWTRYYEGLLSQQEKMLPKVQQIEMSHNRALAELQKQISQNSNVSHKEILNAKQIIDQKYYEDVKNYAREAHNFLVSLDDSGLIRAADNYTKRLEKLNEFHQAGLVAEELYQSELALIREKYQDEFNQAKDKATAEKLKKGKQKALEDFWGGRDNLKAIDAVQEGLKSIGDGFSNLTSNMDKASGAYKALFAVQKAFSVASAMLSCINAWANALRDLPWPENLVAYAQAVAMTGSLMGQITSVSMHDKGGNIPAGHYGIVGEIGPELIRGPATVTSRKDTEDLLSNRGGANVVVNLIEDASRAGRVEQNETDEETVIQICVANIHRGGEIADAISNTYGLARQGV